MSEALTVNQLRLLTCAEMAAADRAAADFGADGIALMERAGRAVADAACDMTMAGATIVVLCGPGNNGGDGFVAARILSLRGRVVKLALLGERAALKGDAAHMAALYDGPEHLLEPDTLASKLDEAALVIDAVFGAGLTRPIDPASAVGRTLDIIQRRRVPVLAVDVPSGLDGDSGAASGVALHAERTVTFFRPKPGHILVPGRILCGRLMVADIGIPADVLNGGEVAAAGSTDGQSVWLNGPALWRGALPRFGTAEHKYTRGHALVVSGGPEMAGAARLAGHAALRAGAGLVTIAVPPDALSAHAGPPHAALLHAGQSAETLSRLLSDQRKTATVIGPGLGGAGINEPAMSQSIRQRVKAVLGAEVTAHSVLDADALTAMAADRETFFKAIVSRPDRVVVLTPHDGEFARLFPELAGDDALSKLTRARLAAKMSGAVIVLKGPDTVIAAPDGRAAINNNAPPWLATAGAGDVLAGMVGGLLAGRMPGFEAASAAVWIHGAAATQIGEGLIADDLPEAIVGVRHHLQHTL